MLFIDVNRQFKDSLTKSYDVISEAISPSLTSLPSHPYIVTGFLLSKYLYFC